MTPIIVDDEAELRALLTHATDRAREEKDRLAHRRTAVSPYPQSS